MRRLVYGLFENGKLVARSYSESELKSKMENLKQENPNSNYHIGYKWKTCESRFW